MDHSKSVPALITNGDYKTRAEITSVISSALGNRKVTLTSDVLTKDSRVIIEPKGEPMDPFGNPMSGRLLGKPDHFVLRALDGQCFLHHEQTDTYHELETVTCSVL